MIKNDTKTVVRNHLHYVLENGQRKRFKPWLEDSVSFLYDAIMKHAIFPRKFGGNMNRHYEILSHALKSVHGKRVLELASGSGSAVNFLPNDNPYTGIDISPGLLKKAVKRFNSAGFKEAEFYVTSAEALPFDDNCFSVCLCILSLNFFTDVTNVFREIKRVLLPGGAFFCSVPVPERKGFQDTIRGSLYSERDLEKHCQAHGFRFESMPVENGALLYFKATLA